MPSAEELQALKDMILKCVRADILGGDPWGFVDILDDALEELDEPANRSQKACDGPNRVLSGSQEPPGD